MARGDDENEEGGALTGNKDISISKKMDKIVTILFQNKAHSLLRGCVDLSKLNYKSNVGVIIEALLDAVGLGCSHSGDLLWRKAEPGGVKLKWIKPAVSGSRKPPDARVTALGGLEGVDLAHDAAAPTAGSGRAQAAAEAARPPLPHALELVRPQPGERIGRVGSGWGNVPRPLTACCLAEQVCLDDLVLRVHQHALTCSAPLRRVHDDAGAHWSCHSMGLVNVLRFTCANGCCLNWASARRLPGPPAKPTPAAAQPCGHTGPANGAAATTTAAAAATTEATARPGPATDANAADAAPTVDASTLKPQLERALAHAKRTRDTFSLADVAREACLGERARDAIGRFVLGKSTPQPETLIALAVWVREHAPPPAQTQVRMCPRALVQLHALPPRCLSYIFMLSLLLGRHRG